MPSITPEGSEPEPEQAVIPGVDLRVLRAAAALARAVSVDEVLDAIFEHAVRWLGGRSIGVWLLDESHQVLRFGGGVGLAPGSAESQTVVQLDSGLPAAMVVRTGDPVMYHSLEERGRRWPALAMLPSASPAAVVLKLDARGKRLGCLTLTFAEPEAIQARLTTLEAVAEQCALALDRALLLEAERRARETLEFLAAGTALMVSALEPDEVVDRLVQLAVPRLADWCAVYLASGGFLVQTASAGVPGGQVPGLDDPSERMPVHGESPVAVAYRTGRSQPIPDPVAGSEVTSDEGPRDPQPRTGVAVPLETAGHIVGVMVVWNATDRAGEDVDVYALNGLAARAGMALTNARKYHQQLEAADMLAAAVLPAELPTPPTIEFAARYIPAGAAVAGDWYDAFTRPDGVVVFGVGDASGHGLPAVAAMTALRNAARALGFTGMDPAEMLRQMSLLAELSGPEDAFATAFYATVDPATGRGAWSSAGHLPPLLLRPDDTVEFLSNPSAPLGVVAPPSYVDRPLDLGAGSVLVVVSDGVIERRWASLDDGLEDLRLTVLTAPDHRAETIAAHVAERLCAAPEDDCCILVVRRSP